MKIIRRFRTFLRGPIGRGTTAAVIVASLYAFSDPTTYLYALEQQRAKEGEIRAIAKKLGVDPEFLLHPEGSRKFDLHSVMAWANEKLGLAQQSKPAALQPLDVHDSISQVKARYALVSADTAEARLAALVRLSRESSGARGKKKGAIKGEIESALRLLQKDLLPPLPDGLPAVAQSRHGDAKNAIETLRNLTATTVQSPTAFDDANIDTTLQQLASALSGTLDVPKAKARWTHDPFPLKDAYRTAPKKPGLSLFGTSVGSTSTLIPAATQVPQLTPARMSAPQLAVARNAVSSEVSALAATLQTPAKAFTWGPDRIDWEPYSGVAKGALGTLKESRGNDWDQALLLRDLLVAQNYQAQIEWGKVTIPIARLMNLAGTEDPLQAANLFATAGFDGTIQMNGGQPVAVQMTHAWVRAFLPFLPNRGTTAGTPDTWVRLDPSFKRYNYQPGLAVNAAWSEDDYLQNSPVEAPTDFYSDKLWTSIRNSGIDCKTLGQVPKTGTIRAENFPFIPSTLTAQIDQTLGLAVDPPASQLQHVQIAVSSKGTPLAAYAFDLASVWGKKVTLTFPPATADDAAIINSYGGLFNTPAYLIKLQPVISIDDVPVATGSAVAAGAALDMNLTFDQPNVATDSTHHDVVAGETHTLAFDAGATPDTLLVARSGRLQTLTDPEAILSEKLLLIGLGYMGGGGGGH